LEGRAQLHRHAQPVAKGVTLTAEDIREGLVAVLSVFVAEPSFRVGQDRLNNPEMLSAVDSQVRLRSNTG
jgi:DNA gyrase/topoisomerase IV subunit B